MPDLSIEHRIVCKTTQEYRMEFPSKSDPDKVYVAEYGDYIPGLYMYNWDCDCWPFKKSKKCKHIEEAEKKQMETCDLDGYRDYLTEYPEDRKCPKCGNDLTVIKVAV